MRYDFSCVILVDVCGPRSTGKSTPLIGAVTSCRGTKGTFIKSQVITGGLHIGLTSYTRSPHNRLKVKMESDMIMFCVTETK